MSVQDYQIIRLQEVSTLLAASSDTTTSGARGDGDGDGAASRVPKCIEVEARGFNVNCCSTGDIIQVVGVVRAAPDISGNVSTSSFTQRRKSSIRLEAGVHQLQVLANSIWLLDTTSSGRSSVAVSSTSVDVGPRRCLMSGGICGGTVKTFSRAQLSIVRSIAARTQFALPDLIASVCPAIYGHELVKFGLVLALFGCGSTRAGLPHHGQDVVRSSIHVLMVGDPGVGKSQMLRGVAACAPRAVSISSNTSTTAGLTASVLRDGADIILDAGALVLADQVRERRHDDDHDV